MTELKCPFCGQKLKRFNEPHNKCAVWVCKNYNDPDNVCIASGYLLNDDMLNFIYDTKKKLDRAIRVIQEVSKMSDKLSRKYGNTLVEQLDTIQAFCWEQGYILTHDEDFKRVEQIKDKEQQ